jgi:hypothetical protein
MKVKGGQLGKWKGKGKGGGRRGIRKHKKGNYDQRTLYVYMEVS